MKRNVLTTLILLALYGSASAQLVIDKKAIAKSGENVAVNVIKQQHYKKIRDFTEEIYGSYTAIEVSPATGTGRSQTGRKRQRSALG